MTSNALVAAGSRSNTALRSCRIAFSMSMIVRCSDRFNQTNGVGDHPLFPAHRIKSFSALHLHVHLVGVDARSLGHFFLHRGKMRRESRGLSDNDGIDIADAIALRLELTHHVFQQLET